MGLKKLTIKDEKLFAKFLGLKRHGLSTYAFPNIYIWKALFDIRWLIIKDSLCVFFKDKIGGFLYLAPLSKEKNRATFKKAFQVLDTYNSNPEVSRIENVEAGDVQFYRELGYDCTIKSYDYLCERRDLERLEGDRFKSKRACFNYFIKHYDFEYLPFSLKHKDDCLKLYNCWMRQRKNNACDHLYLGMLEDSRLCLENALNNYSGLNLTGRIIKVNKEIRAFTFGFKLNQDTFCILYEITDLAIKGLAQFIFRSFSGELKDYKYINIMDDSGLKNLKRVKLSYHPIRLIPAYIARRKHDPTHR